MDHEPFTLDDGLRQLSHLVLRDETLETTLDRIVQVANRAIPDTVGVSITLRKGRRPYTAATTSSQALAIDEREYAVEEGPCLSAMETGELQRLPDVEAEIRWPRFTQVCREEGLGSSLGVPLKVGPETYGAMNLYFSVAHAFDEDHEAAAQLLADQAGVSIANTRTYVECGDKIRQLQEALDTRVVIEQAKGVLMASMRIDDEAAFQLLRERSQRSNRKLRSVAEEVVAGVLAGAP
jgi:GAF domain-containing protein